MSDTQAYSDELISAYVDGELEPEERRALLQAASGCDRLSGRICEAAYLKELVQGAYRVPAARVPVPSRVFRGHRTIRYAAAAAVGALSLFGVMSLQQQEYNVQRITDVVPAAGRIPAQTVDERASRVVFHVSSADPAVAGLLLDQVELLLQSYSNEGRTLKVEVVANNEGLRLLQQGRSPFPQRIQQLDDRYPNLLFAACGNTMERYRRERGERIAVLPQAVIIQSGVQFVARRQHEGWSYIKV